MKLGLIGKKLGHSYSPILFEQFFSEAKISNASYGIFEFPNLSRFKNWLIENPDIKGLNVTVPYKEAILELVDEKSTRVQKIGATNTLKIKNSTIIAYNTDVDGFMETLGKSPNTIHSNCLILGSGGVSKTVQYVLNDVNIPFHVASRKMSKLHYQYAELPHLANYSTIINCTPLGMYPNNVEKPGISYSQITKDHHLIDLIYNPSMTSFLLEGCLRGATVTNGLSMLKAQAKEAWRIWQSDLR